MGRHLKKMLVGRKANNGILLLKKQRKGKGLVCCIREKEVRKGPSFDRP